MLHKVVFQIRATYTVDAKSSLTASKKAYQEMIEALPNAGEGSEDEKVMCIDMQIDQVLPLISTE